MVIISPAVDDDLLAIAAANNGTTSDDDPAAAAALSLFDVVHGTTADGVAAGTWWSSQPPNYAASTAVASSGSGAYASSSVPPPPPPPPSLQQSLGWYYAAGSIMDTCLFPAQPQVHMQMQTPALPPLLLKAGSSTGSTSGQQTAACTGTEEHPMAAAAAAALLCEEQRRRCQLQRAAAALSNGGAPASGVVAVAVAVEGHRHHQQAASAAMIAPTTGTGPRPRYADTSAVGVRFQPTDEELIGYLRMKYDAAASARQRQRHRQQHDDDDDDAMPVDFFKEFDVYHAHPMAIKGACGESQDGCWYAFSPRDRKYRNGQRPARSVFAEGGGGSGKEQQQQQQVGFWKSNSKLGEVREGGRKNGAVIGRMTSLTFQVGRQPRGTQTGWKMKEYTIPENQHQPDGAAMLLNDWVACKLYYKERPEQSKTEPERRKGDKDKNTFSVEHKRPRRSRKSKKGKKDMDIHVAAVGQEEDGPAGEAAGESVQGEEEEEDMPHMVVPAAHHQAASDYSDEQDLCVEDYIVCDLAFAQQADVQTVP